MSHTKRSDVFRNIAFNHAAWLRSLSEHGAATINDAIRLKEIADILENNTTDSRCLVRAADDEPIFVLRAKDPIAHDAVRFWTDCADARNLHESDKLDDALGCADEMLAFLRDLEAGLKV